MSRRLLLLASLLCGCGTTITYTPIARRGHPQPKPAAEVDVYLSGPPDRPYRDIGLLEAAQETDLSVDDTRDMLRKLRARAGKMGCDAIYVNGVGSKPESFWSASFTRTDSLKTVTATCIRYKPAQNVAPRER